MKILTHRLPSLDYREDTDSILLLDADCTPSEIIDNKGTQAFEVKTRERIAGLLPVDFNPGTSLRAQNNQQSNQILGCWENILPGIDVILQLTSSNTTTNRLWILVNLVNRWVGQTYYGRFTEIEISSTQSLETVWTNVHTFQENGHVFFLIESLNNINLHLLVDVFVHNATMVATNRVRVTDAGFTRTFNNFIVRNPGAFQNQEVYVRNVTNYSALTGYFTPSITGVTDLISYEATLDSSLPVIIGENVGMVCYAASILRSGMYYPVNTRIAELVLPAGETSIRVPDTLASLYHIQENENPGAYFSTLPWYDQDVRAGLRVSQGVPVSEYHTGVSTPITPQLPTTPTNNVFPKGFSFLQWLQPKANNTKFSLQRARLIPRITQNEGVYMFSQSGHPHLRLGVSASNTQAFYSVPIGDRQISGVIVDSTSGCLNPIHGDFVNLISVSSGENDTPAVAQLPWIPFTQKGRTFNNVAGLSFITPVFGMRVEKIQRFFSLGDGRLAAACGGDLYVSSPVRTNPEFPSFLDFQVRVNPASPQLNAEVYQLNLKEITSVTSTQVGYFVGGREGLLNVNKITGIVDKLLDYQVIGTFFNAGLYFVIGVGRYSVFQYDDNTKQFVELKTGRIHPELQTLIGFSSRVFSRNLNRKYIDYSNKVIGFTNKGVVAFLNRYNVLCIHRYPCNSFSFCGRYIHHVFNSNTPQNNHVNPQLGLISLATNGTNFDVVSPQTTGAVTKANIGVIDNTSIYQQNYNRFTGIDFSKFQQINTTDNIIESGQVIRKFDPCVITNLKTVLKVEEGEPRVLLADQKSVNVIHVGFPTNPNVTPFFEVSMGVYQDKFASITSFSNLLANLPENIDDNYSAPVRIAFNKAIYVIRFSGTIVDFNAEIIPRRSTRRK